MKVRPESKLIHFFAPSLKHFDTDEFTNSGLPIFAPASVTGEHCDLGCRHCGGRLLKGMHEVPEPEDLWRLANRLKERGCRGILLTGGCDRDGVVPLARHCGTLRRLKRELGFATAVHSKLVDERLADALVESDTDAVMIDAIGSTETDTVGSAMPITRCSDTLTVCVWSMARLSRCIAAVPFMAMGWLARTVGYGSVALLPATIHERRPPWDARR